MQSKNCTVDNHLFYFEIYHFRLAYSKYIYEILYVFDHSIVECDIFKLYVSLFGSQFIINVKEVVILESRSVYFNVLKYYGSVTFDILFLR